MHPLFKSKYFKIGLTLFLTVCACLIFASLFSAINLLDIIDGFFSLLMPFVIGFAIAYLIHPVMAFLERRVFGPLLQKRSDKVRRRLTRGLSVALSMILVLLLLIALLFLIIPQLVASIQSLISRTPGYIDTVSRFLDDFFAGNPEAVAYLDTAVSELSELLQGWAQNLSDQLPQMLNTVAAGVVGFVTVVFNTLVGMIVSCYVLYNKETFIAQAKKVLFALFPTSFARRSISVLGETHIVFGGFLTGIIIDSFFIGILCFIGISLLQMPYAVLIAVIVGVTNVIPFFGPFIGAIPSAFLILMEDPKKVIWFILFIIALQQFDGNILKPKILGGTTGLPTFWVLFAILVGGGLFGFIGMFLGVPVFSVIYTLASRFFNRRLIKKNLPKNTDAYLHVSDLTTKPPSGS